MPTRARKARAAAIANGTAVRGKRTSTYITRHPAADYKSRAVLDTIGRDNIRDVLGAIVPPEDETSPAARLLAYLGDNAFKGHTITRLMRDAGLTLPEIVDIVRNYDIAIGMIQAARHVPDVLNDIGEDAKSRLVECLKCSGTGKEGGAEVDEELREIIGDSAVVGLPDCEYCGGSGKLRQIGDSDSRKILLETMGVYNKRGPQVAIQKNTQINNYGGASAPEDVTVKVQKMLDGQ